MKQTWHTKKDRQTFRHDFFGESELDFLISSNSVMYKFKILIDRHRFSLHVKLENGLIIMYKEIPYLGSRIKTINK